MKVGIVHNSLNPTGGGERVCMAIIEALRDANHEVVLATCDKTNWTKIEKSFGKIQRPTEERMFVPIRIPVFGIYQRLFSSFLIERLRSECDVVVNSHGDMVPTPCHLTYMHFPTFLMNQEIYSPVNIKYRKSMIWRAYFMPYMYTQVRLIKRYTKSGAIVTNSSFSQRVIQKMLGRHAEVVYPPVDVETFTQDANEREDLVVTCSRISPEKRLHLVPRIAAQLPDVQFKIIGSTSYVSGSTLKQINHEIAEYNVENVQLLTNFSLECLLDLYSRAKVYLHTMDNEHFGISPVEAMASGLIPVVHKSGGPWLDIIEKGKYGFGYETEQEAVEAVSHILTNWDSLTELRRKIVEKAQTFSKKRFKNKILTVVEALNASYNSFSSNKTVREMVVNS